MKISLPTSLALILGWALSNQAADDNGRVIYTTEVDAAVESVWNAFTTDEGLKSWMAPLVTIDLSVGGLMRANYAPEGELGDASTIVNTILAFDPERMLTLKATKFPEGFPFLEAAQKTWSVFYFEPISEDRTQITVVGLGYTDEEESQQMRGFFALANQQSLDKLKASLSKPKAVVETPKEEMNFQTRKVTPFLMFEGGAGEAIALYTEVFDNATIDGAKYYGPEGPGKEGTIEQAYFTIENQTVMVIDSYIEHGFTFTPSFSFFVNCEDEAQFSRYHKALSKDGKEMMPPDNYGFSQKFCWTQDRFGVSWQINLP